MTETAYDRLFEAIVSCEVPPGAWMKASEFAAFLDLSRTPTAQALLRLEAAGFTRPVKRKGWQITPLTLQRVQDIVETYRLTVPALAILVARNATDEQIDTVRELQYRWLSEESSASLPAFDAAPFRYFASICGNPIMAEMTRGVSAHMERVFNFALRQGHFNSEMFRLRDAALDAMASRDEKRIRSAMEKLVVMGSVELERILKGASSVRSAQLFLERAS